MCNIISSSVSHLTIDIFFLFLFFVNVANDCHYFELIPDYIKAHETCIDEERNDRVLVIEEAI